MHRSSRRSALGSLAGLATLCAAAICGTASAQSTYPNRPIKLVVPYAPGGNTDIVGRMLAERLSARLGQQVIVENRAGAGGKIGTDVAARAAPDGYTILLTSNATHMSHAALDPKLPYDPMKGFVVVSKVGSVPFVLGVPPTVGVDTLDKLVKAIKAAPDKYSYASAGPGTSSHLVALDFERAIGGEVTHIPYKGNGPAYIDLLAGRVQYMFDAPSSMVKYTQDKRLQVLAITGPKRNPMFPDVPTFTEAGYPQFNDWTATNIILAPAGTPPAAVERLNLEIGRALAEPAVLQRMAQLGLGSVEPVKPDALANYFQTEWDRWVPPLRALGIKPQ